MAPSEQEPEEMREALAWGERKRTVLVCIALQLQIRLADGKYV